MMDIIPKARVSGLVVQEMPDEVLVYDLATNRAHCLNSSAAVIWRACDGTRTVADIVKEFETNGKGSVTEDFVWLALDQLQENELLETRSAKRFDATSRRQVLKTIGIASVAAIPVIASLATPRSALAATSCHCTVGNNNPVTGNNLDCEGQGAPPCAGLLCPAGTCAP